MEKQTSSASPRKKRESKQVITVKMDRYQSLIKAFSDSRTSFRIVFTIIIIGVLLFFGIAVITLSIKRLYPYSDITTNGLGATTIKSEKNEVSYWLFNTAILWADSGISVKEGDILTIRSSGKSHTAVHHLYNSANDNKELTDNWVGAEGELDKDNNRDFLRRQFRVFPNEASGALIMQVSKGGKFYDSPDYPGASKDCFYMIGKERQNIYIHSSGTLGFAVNDIVLNRHTIAKMVRETMLESMSKEEMAKYKNDDSLLVRFNKWVNDQKYHPDSTKNEIGKMAFQWTIDIDEKTKKPCPPICELSYYYGKDSTVNQKRKTAWFDDNVGSFLIMIEKIR